MGSILDAANVSASQDKFLIGKLPTKSGEASIMTLDQIHTALGGYVGIVQVFDPSVDHASKSSTYYMYGISSDRWHHYDSNVSTLDNLRAVGVDCFVLFGGPLYDVNHNYGMYDTYGFEWFTSENRKVPSSDSSYWGHNAFDPVYVAVVHS